MSKVFKGGVVTINGLPAAHAGPGGHAAAQEECWVTVAGQRVKQPFMNIAQGKDLKATASRNFVNGYPLATLASYTATSYGDEASEGGVKSGTVQGRSCFLSASPNVFIEGKPAVRHGDKVLLNNMNSEETTWVQPGKAAAEVDSLLSDPLEDLPKPKSLAIELIRNPAHALDAAGVQHYFLVQHQETGHKTYHTFGVFKAVENKFLWHDAQFREGEYTVSEIYPKTGTGIMQIPLGKIKTRDKEDTTPGLTLIPLMFKRYDDLQASLGAAKSLYPQTYVYLYKDGKLWRELEVTRTGRLKEVDLSFFGPQALRYADGDLKQGILLPVEDALGTHEFQIAVSHQPWSREMMDRLAGSERLQPMDIHALIRQGEKTRVIDPKETQDKRLRSVHASEPLASNRDWVIARDKLQHSVCTQGVEHDLAWQGDTAVVLLHDPLGRLIETAESMINQHLELLAYNEANGEAYVLGQLVGQVINSDQGVKEAYYKHVDDFARNKFMKAFDEKHEAHQAMMRECSEALRCWFEASCERGQWEDFHQLCQDERQIPTALKRFREIHENVMAAFMLTPEGLAYLQGEVKQANSRILEMTAWSERWLKLEYSGALFKNTIHLLATTLEPTETGFKKITDFHHSVTGESLNARLIQVPESDLIAHHRSVQRAAETTISTTLRVDPGQVTLQGIDLKPASPRMITVVEIEGKPIYSLGQALNKQLTKSAKLRAGLSAVMLFNTRSLMEQLDALKAQGDLPEGTFLVLHGEIMRNAIIISELTLEGIGLMTDKIAGQRLTQGAMRMAKRLSLPGLMVGAVVDVLYLRNYGQTGENALTRSYALSLTATVISIMTVLFSKMPWAKVLGIYATVFTFVAGLAILYFTKNEIEKWLFQGHWGLTQGKKDSTEHSLEKFHFMIPMVHLLQFYARDEVQRPLLGRDSAVLEDRFGWTLPSLPKAVHDFYWVFQLRHDPSVLLRLTVWVMTPLGLECLKDRYLEIRSLGVEGDHTRWSLRLSGHHFPREGVLGRLVFYVDDAQTAANLGYDAYEFIHDLTNGSYLCTKVIHGPRH